MIEDSVLDQLRTAFTDAKTRDQLRVYDADLEAFEHDPIDLVRALVKNVSYDGKTGAVLLNLRAKEPTHED
jgi:hypothetical protein